MKKKLFVFNIDNTIDLITNSSSELFVLQGDTQEQISELIRSIYPDYLNEYREVVRLKDASEDDKYTYVNWVEESWYNSERYDFKLSEEERYKKDVEAAIAKAKKYGMKPETFYKGWKKSLENKNWFYTTYSEKGLNKIIKTVDPDGKIYLLYSIDENPDWEHQERLMEIASRYHLG